QGRDLVGDGETDRRPLPAHHAPCLDETAEPEALAGRDLHLGHLARAVEEDDRVAHGVEHESDRDPEHHEAGADQNASPLLPRHDFNPSSAASWSSCWRACALPVNWLLARASAFNASSLRSSTL